MRNPIGTIVVALVLAIVLGANAYGVYLIAGHTQRFVSLVEERQLKAAKPDYGPHCNAQLDRLVPCPIIQALIQIESSGRPRAVSQAGAIGLMQLRPVVYDNLCGLSREEAFVPDKNVACGTIFLYLTLKRYNGNLEQALRHYNSGFRRLDNGYSERVASQMVADLIDAGKGSVKASPR